jgi:hypothetical protein
VCGVVGKVFKLNYLLEKFSFLKIVNSNDSNLRENFVNIVGYESCAHSRPRQFEAELIELINEREAEERYVNKVLDHDDRSFNYSLSMKRIWVKVWKVILNLDSQQ